MRALDDCYPNLRLLTLSEEADLKRLLFLLSGSCEPEGLTNLENDSYIIHQKPKLQLPASRIANLVLSHNPLSLGAKSVVVELDYIDRDSNIAYAQLYARAFRDYPRRTLRLHFLRKQFTSFDDLLSEDEIKNSYIGYCVLFATNPGSIGRTVLPPPKDNNSWIFIPAQSSFSVNLSGVQLYPKVLYLYNKTDA